jgi:hypothetical protein
MGMLAFPDLAQRRLMLQFSRLEELRPPVLPSVQASAAHTKVRRDLLVQDSSLTERTHLFDVFLSELGRLTWASLAAGAVVLARHAFRNDLLTSQKTR